MFFFLFFSFSLFLFWRAGQKNESSIDEHELRMSMNSNNYSHTTPSPFRHRYNIEKDIAAYIKKEFDKKYNPTWHCIVGRNFGSYVTHETKHFIYFYLGQVAILLFKSG